MKKTKVGVGIHEVKIVDQGVEARVRFQDVEGFFAGHLVPAVDKVNKDTGAVRGEAFIEGFGDGRIKLAVGGVDQEIKTTSNGEANWPSGSKKAAKVSA
jgi:hypothetical protein